MAPTEVRERPPAPYAPPVGEAPHLAAGAEPSAGDAMPAADAPSAPDGVGMPRDTTPTWEIELLVSGAVLFGLLQVPPLLHALWERYAPHFGVAGAAGAGVLLMVLGAAVYALIGCFLVHLALRGYWVALVGAHSVFPGGVRWDRQREFSGPITAEVGRALVRPLPEFIARADNVASLVFAGGFVLAATTLASAVGAATIVAIFAVSAALLPVKQALFVMAGLGLALMLVMMGAGVADMRYGARIAPGSRAHRFVSTVLRGAGGLTPAGVRSLSAVLTSNVDKRVAWGALLAGLLGAYGMARTVMQQDDSLPGLGAYAYFSEEPQPGVVAAFHYDALRADGDGNLSAPSIQSDVITEPYVRLFVPYRPGRHNEALSRACPGLPRPVEGDTSEAGAAVAAVLACATRLHAVTLDGRALAGARFRFFTNPRVERRGFLMLIPTAGLAPGEHVITVRPAVRDGRPATPIRIPFWI